MLKPNPQYDGVWGWDLWEVISGALINGVSALIKETPERSMVITKRQSSMTQEANLHKTPNLLVL